MTDASANLIDRAFGAYVASDGYAAEQPTLTACSVEVVLGRRYVALRSRRRTVAVYRVRATGFLRRLRCWPIELIDRRFETIRPLKCRRSQQAGETHA